MVVAERLANVYANHGIEIAIVGMTVVFIALAVIAIIIALLPHLITQINRIIPEPSTAPKVVVKSNNDEAIALAIALAHHQDSQK